MRLLVCTTLLSTVLAVTGAADIARARELCGEVFGACDSATLESILAEEAAKMGKSTQEHVDTCSGIIDLEKLATHEEARSIVKEWHRLDISDRAFTSANELRDYLTEHVPTSMKVTQRFFANAQQKGLSYASIGFTGSILEELLDVFAVLSNYEPVERQHTEEYAVFQLIKKKIAEYNGLPEEAKKDLEQTFCLHTIYRVFEEIAQMERHITEVDAEAARNHVTYPLNVTRALDICEGTFHHCNSLTPLLIQEARAIGVAPQAHIDTCTATLDLQALVTRDQIDSIQKEVDSPEFRAERFENVLELETYLEQSAPSFVAFLKRLDVHSRKAYKAAKAGIAASEFLRQFVGGVYEIVVANSKVTNPAQRNADGKLRFAKHLLQQADNYAALKEDAKLDLQRWLCVVTIARAAEDAGVVAELRNEIERFGPKE